MHAVIILATVHVVIMGDLHVLWYTIDELELCKSSFCLKVLGCLTSAFACADLTAKADRLPSQDFAVHLSDHS